MDRGNIMEEIPCDTVVLAIGMAVRTDCTGTFSNLADAVLYAGDCNVEKGNLY
jgi:hypothetical protein